MFMCVCVSVCLCACLYATRTSFTQLIYQLCSTSDTRACECVSLCVCVSVSQFDLLIERNYLAQFHACRNDANVTLHGIVSKFTGKQFSLCYLKLPQSLARTEYGNRRTFIN